MTLACAYTPISRCHASYMCTCVSRCSVWIDHSVLTGRSDLSVERNRVDSITTSNEFDTPFYYEDVAICWAFSLDSRSFSLSPFPHCPSSSRSRSLFHSLGQSVRRIADSLLPTMILGDLCLLAFSLSLSPTALFLTRSPGPEVVMSNSVARLVASCRIAANDDVTLETSRLVIQVVSCSVA